MLNKSKMFTYNGKRMVTWNPFTGCNFNCSYCWARKLAEGKLKASYPNGFIPEFHPNRINRKFKAGEFVFVSSMGDISFCPDYDYVEIMSTVADNPETRFLILTKAPSMYIANQFPPNIYAGATIETNRDITLNYSKAPNPRQRALDMMMSDYQPKFISIEPIMDFDLAVFAEWLYDINPEIVEIGADNYHNDLPEPSWDKVYKLIDILTLHGVKVIQKDGLQRLNLI